MSSYKWLFHSNRYPVKPADTAEKFDPASNNHLVVLRKNRFYLVPLSDASGREFSAAELEAQFNNIIQHAGSEVFPVPIGALTGDNRDLWADARKVLLEAGKNNADTLQKIESAMIVIALDDTKPVTREDISWQTWVGNGRNRWYDKHQCEDFDSLFFVPNVLMCLLVIVYDNGRSGFLGEHSCMDGTPTLRMNEFILASLAAGKVDLGPATFDKAALPPVQELTFDINDAVKDAVKGSEKRFDELVGKHDLHVRCILNVFFVC